MVRSRRCWLAVWLYRLPQPRFVSPSSSPLSPSCRVFVMPYLAFQDAAGQKLELSGNNLAQFTAGQHAQTQTTHETAGEAEGILFHGSRAAAYLCCVLAAIEKNGKVAHPQLALAFVKVRIRRRL